MRRGLMNQRQWEIPVDEVEGGNITHWERSTKVKFLCCSALLAFSIRLWRCRIVMGFGILAVFGVRAKHGFLVDTKHVSARHGQREHFRAIKPLFGLQQAQSKLLDARFHSAILGLVTRLRAYIALDRRTLS